MKYKWHNDRLPEGTRLNEELEDLEDKGWEIFSVSPAGHEKTKLDGTVYFYCILARRKGRNG